MDRMVFEGSLNSAGPASLRRISLSSTLILFVILLLLFTPFEADGSLTFNYLISGACAVVLFLMVGRAALEVLRDPGIALLLPLSVLLHTVFYRPEFSAYPLLMLLTMLNSIMMVIVAREMPREMVLAARTLIVVNMAALLFQYMVYQTGGYVLDLHNMLFPTSVSRVMPDALGAIRVSGIQTEPGNYATWVALLILISRILSGRFSIIEYVATATIAITFSATGMVLIALLVCWMVWDSMRGATVKAWLMLAGFGALLVAAALALDIGEHFEDRFLGRTDGSLLYRYMALDAYDRLSIGERLTGFGFLREICDDCHFHDLGFGPNLYMRGGLLVALGAIPWLIRSLRMAPLLAVMIVSAAVYVAKIAPHGESAWFSLLLLSGVQGLNTLAVDAEAKAEAKAEAEAEARQAQGMVS